MNSLTITGKSRTLYLGHRPAAGNHLAELRDVGVHLVPPPLLYLTVVLFDESSLIIPSSWPTSSPVLLAVVERLSTSLYKVLI